MKKRLLILLAVTAVAAIFIAGSGCLKTGTVVITAKLAPDANGDPVPVGEWDRPMRELEVDLTNNATFRDYQDDIRNIDNIGFYVSATNNSFNPITFQLFLEPDTSVNYDSLEAMLVSPPDLILTDLAVGGNQAVKIDWNASMQYVTNLDYFKDVLKGGVFSIYPAALPRNEFNLTIDSLVVIITLTGSK